MEMKYSRGLNDTTNKARIRDINIRLELGVNGIKNGIQKSGLRLFGHVMRMLEGRLPKKILHIKQARKRPRRLWIDQIRKDREMRTKN